MPDLTPDTTAKDVVADLAAALSGATVSGSAIFASVVEADDIESFQRLADPLKGTVAGVIASPPERLMPEDNGASSIERMRIEIAFRFSLKRKPGEGEGRPMTEMLRLASLVKQAIELDRTRGGRCGVIGIGNELIRGTEIDGRPRMIGKPSNQSFYTAVLPVVCGWEQ